MINQILDFWFKALEPKQWFVKDLTLDSEIKQRFEAIYVDIVAGKCKDWESSPEGCLALVIVLDQLSRNMFRDTPQAFAADSQALQMAERAIELGFDALLNETQRRFLYMPFMHSENPQTHEKAVELFTALGNEMTLEYEYKHKAIIDRFGRYPHRNEILRRISTPEEIEFLSGPDSSF